MSDSKPPHVAILASPGLGHLFPLAEFAARLARRHGFAVTLITFLANHPQAQRSVLDFLPDEVNVTTIPPPPANAPDEADAEARLFASVASNLPFLRTLLSALSSTANLVAVIVDIFGVDVFDVAAEIGIPGYLFFTSSSLALCFGFHIHKLDDEHEGRFADLAEPVRMPGCVPVHGRDLPDAVHDRGSEAYRSLLRLTRRHGEAKGILVNSFEGLEPGAVGFLRGGGGGEGHNINVPPVYPVGPVVWTGPVEPRSGSECLKWLDRQPDGSVMFVSFGSGGTLTWQQMEEVAWGLEASGQRFLWAVKSPSESKARTAFYLAQDKKDPLEFLPAGFLDRTRELGLVVPSWAPQPKVLGHASTGGFLTHCGWNSALESIVHGVPMIAWPLHAEQRMNAAMLTEDVKVALRPKPDEGGLIGREEISRVVSCLIEGEEGKVLRSTARKLSDDAAKALGEGGSSFISLHEVVQKWKATREC